MTTHALNALSRAASSYLRSAMQQPVQWNEWSEEAFALAQRENKPILLDIGAVWCHWCHVMDRESYDDPEIAQIINEHFVAIKVDRDERPDIDSRYQVAVQAVSGQGGWPLTAFLTPDGKPFYGGTYFPPGDHYGRPSFRRVLLAISDAYNNKNGDVLEQAGLVGNAIAQSESHDAGRGPISPSIVDDIIQTALKMFDSNFGGFGSSPKFFHPSMIDILIDGYVQTGDQKLRDVFVSTLEHMARGGVYDQLAGGFHRYSVDEHWIVPHFEKMAYDNSDLLKNYVHAYQATGSEFFGSVAKDMIRWMDEWLSDRQRGGFYASQDADISMDDDGDYFTWTLDEAQAALTEDEAAVAALHYDINDVGEMHHNPAKNVLYVRASLEEISERLNKNLEQVTALLDSAKKKMYAARLKRPAPYVDKTVYTSWNALCISAYLEAGRVLDLDSARHFGLRSLDRVLAEAWKPQRGLLHVVAYSDPEAQHREVAAVLDDYAFLANACLDAYETTADLSYFNFARSIVEKMIEQFYDSASGGFFDTAPGFGEKILGVLNTRRKPFQDSPTPAGNPVAAIALLRLHAYTDEAGYREKAQRTLEVLAGTGAQYGIFAATYGIAVIHFSRSHTQLIVLGSDGLAKQLYQTAIQPFAFGKAVLALVPEAAVAQNLPPALGASIPQLPAVKSKNSAAILCSNFTCQPPIFEAKTLARELETKR
ncbi:MAG TPA: thioredoxin domain-containing protein [Terriglobales bacterium]|nr:thioredoxin domain-containing protein [Terriglobales bacterium]